MNNSHLHDWQIILFIACQEFSERTCQNSTIFQERQPSYTWDVERGKHLNLRWLNSNKESVHNRNSFLFSPNPHSNTQTSNLPCLEQIKSTLRVNPWFPPLMVDRLFPQTQSIPLCMELFSWGWPLTFELLNTMSKHWKAEVQVLKFLYCVDLFVFVFLSYSVLYLNWLHCMCLTMWCEWLPAVLFRLPSL